MSPRDFNLRTLSLLIIALAGSGVLTQITSAIAQVPIRLPSFVSIRQQPLEPPPHCPVNVTAVVSSSRSISQVLLRFSTSKGNETIPLVFVEGNLTYASYYGVIPPQPLASIVSYSVLAVDTSGFQGISSVHQFLVRNDTTPPTLQWQFPPRSVVADIGPTWLSDVDIGVIANDTGTGVKSAILRFSNSSRSANPLTSADLYGPLPYNVTMIPVDGDRYDGIWDGIIPAMENGTRVNYEVLATDYAGNANSIRQRYDVGSPPSRNADLQIALENLDLVSRTMTVRIVITTNYPSRYPASRFSPMIVQLASENLSYQGNVTWMDVPRTAGYFYQGVLDWTTYLEPGYTQNLYPFDYYYVGFNVTLWLDGLTENNTRREFYVSGVDQFIFDQRVLTSNVTSPSLGTTCISLLARLDRKPGLINPIMQAIYSVFMLLGLTAWLPFRRSYLESRIAVLLGLFTFVVLLFFTVSDILQRQGVPNIIGQPVPLVLLIGLVWSIAIFLAASLVVARIVGSTRISLVARVGKHFLNIALSLLALVVTSLYSGPEAVILGQSAGFAVGNLLNLWDAVSRSFLWSILEVRNYVLLGLFGPSIVLILFEVIAAIATYTKALIRGRNLGGKASDSMGFPI